jgi:thiamine biosynthesis lipoprotein
VISLCDQIGQTSNGYFDIRSHRSDGRPDPTGLVKGWALERAAGILEAAGARNYCINGGGDIVAAGGVTDGDKEHATGSAEPTWRVGIRHPMIADRLATVLAVRDASVATSGTYERGQHIVDPLTGLAPQGLVSVTIVGPTLTLADAYATAAFAMGSSGMEWAAGLTGFAACGVTAEPDGSNARLVWTPGFERYFAADARPSAGASADGAWELPEIRP